MKTRNYPTSCRSSNCGAIRCDGCIFKPALEEFNAWKEKNNAKPADTIWNNTIYITQV